MIFSFFDPVEYNGHQTTDIFRDYNNYKRKALADLKLRTYTITGSPRPEQLATELYGNPNLYWVLLLVNNISDPFYEWIKSNTACHQAAIQKYSQMDNEQLYNNRIVYHVNATGERFYNVEMDEENPGHWYDKGDKRKSFIQYQGALKPVDIFEAELVENEKYRTIKIVDPRDLQMFISNITREMEKVIK